MRQSHFSAIVAVCRDSSVGIGTRQELDGPGSNPCVGEIFRTISVRPLGPTNLLYNGYRVSFPDSGGSVALTTHPHVAPRLKKE